MICLLQKPLPNRYGLYNKPLCINCFFVNLLINLVFKNCSLCDITTLLMVSLLIDISLSDVKDFAIIVKFTKYHLVIYNIFTKYQLV